MTAPRLAALPLRKFCPALVAFVFLALTFWTWRRWPHLLIDYGRELYIPWQMTLGKVLYVDIVHFCGPLAPYYNALLFRIFGASMTVLIANALLLIALAAGGLYALLSRLFEPVTAAMASIAFLSVFAFGHLYSFGMFNYVCPYRYDLVYGVEIALFMLIFLSLHAEDPRGRWSVGAGLCLGLVFLTKAEAFLAAALAACAWLLLLRGKKGAQARSSWRAGAGFIAGALAVVAAGFLVLRASMNTPDALRSLLGTWHPLLTSGIADSPFFQRMLGSDKPWANLAASLRAALFLAFLAAAGILGDFWTARVKELRLPLIAASACVLALAPLALTGNGWRAWILVGAALPLFSLGALAAAIAAVIRARGQGKPSAGPEQLACWAVFAFLLLSKMMLRTTLGGNGFALAMPAALLLIVSMVRLIPDLLKRWYGGGHFFRAAALIAVALDVWSIQGVSNYYYKAKNFAVGSGGDAMLAYGPETAPEGAAVKKALERIRVLMPPQARFLVLPEGIMLNYLARRASPTPYINILPPDLEVYGEEAVLDAMKQGPPDFVLMTHREMREYGTPYFGSDPSYGKRIMDWVRQNYVRAELIGEEPFQRPNRFGIEILKKREVIGR